MALLWGGSGAIEMDLWASRSVGCLNVDASSFVSI